MRRLVCAHFSCFFIRYAVFLTWLCMEMENPSEVFVFSTQQSPIRCVDVELGKGLETNNFAKRARSEHETLFFCMDSKAKEVTRSFKAKLMGMSALSSCSGFGSSKEKLKIETDDITIFEGPNSPVMKLSPRLKEQLHKPWTNVLIFKNMGRSHTLNFMITKLTHEWTLLGKWQLTDLGEGYFVACFQMKEDMDYVLTNGPWVIANQYLVIQKWKLNFII
ncbi:hypothetical protein Ddye_001137 [Dipteronia dyeriana]|uniref:DUF4283 domain-containing protein n=1 Tax=Dipteronia dyeriana TaxID=168575 RepID=A0AAE0CTQ4_9ROSI|nr:hypothetical protein Ddye_001137 [Dipteronia dyeriana]